MWWITGLPHPSWWAVSRHLLVTCFLQRLRLTARELMLCGGLGCHSIALESSALPFLGDQDSLPRSWPSGRSPTHFSHSWPFFSRPICAPSTLGRDFESLAAWASHSQSVSMQLEFLKGNVSGYTCNHGSPKGTRRCISGPYLRHPCKRLLYS